MVAHRMLIRLSKNVSFRCKMFVTAFVENDNI